MTAKARKILRKSEPHFQENVAKLRLNHKVAFLLKMYRFLVKYPVRVACESANAGKIREFDFNQGKSGKKKDILKTQGKSGKF